MRTGKSRTSKPYTNIFGSRCWQAFDTASRESVQPPLGDGLDFLIRTKTCSSGINSGSPCCRENRRYAKEESLSGEAFHYCYSEKRPCELETDDVKMYRVGWMFLESIGGKSTV